MENLPFPLMTLVTCYRGTINDAIENLTEEQIEKVIDEAKKLIQTIECADE